MNLQNLHNTIQSGRVLRYHAAPTVQPQTDAHHQWNAFALLWFITGGRASRNCLVEMLTHDVGEYGGPGDVPFTTKRDNPELKRLLDVLESKARNETTIFPEVSDLTPNEHALIKVCDTLEGLIWCSAHEERGGPVTDRWKKAYFVCKTKFWDLLTLDQWALADAIYSTYLNH